mmetsp:Transcript_20858/g.45958  ORF Transcript_20858/g.45958 Transcript_20858/m.45958 type:complete len:206 (+) Transcript_20858:75-692(+)
MPPAPGPGQKTYAFDPQAYAKVIMHGCKHSSEAVVGVLIGVLSGKALRVVDAVPLFHTHSLGPMLKIAFMLIEQHCRSSGNGLEIIGIYHGSVSGSTELSPVKGIADKVASNFGSATCWALDLAKMSQRQFALHGMYHSKDEWKQISSEAVSVSDEALKQTGRAISEMKYLEIVDFDDHLTDAALNWLNTDLFKGDPIADLATAA